MDDQVALKRKEASREDNFSPHERPGTGRMPARARDRIQVSEPLVASHLTEPGVGADEGHGLRHVVANQ